MPGLDYLFIYYIYLLYLLIYLLYLIIYLFIIFIYFIYLFIMRSSDPCKAGAHRILNLSHLVNTGLFTERDTIKERNATMIA
jgi:hypothetical protein